MEILLCQVSETGRAGLKNQRAGTVILIRIRAQVCFTVTSLETSAECGFHNTRSRIRYITSRIRAQRDHGVYIRRQTTTKKKRKRHCRRQHKTM